MSSDGCKSFEPVDGAASEILRAVARAQSNLQYVGARRQVRGRALSVGGLREDLVEGPAQGTWYFAPGGGVSPNGPTDAGCQSVSQSVLGKQAAYVACTDGSVRSTADGGRSVRRQDWGAE